MVLGLFAVGYSIYLTPNLVDFINSDNPPIVFLGCIFIAIGFVMATNNLGGKDDEYDGEY